MAEQVRYTME
jgi:hypothetical protein